MIVKFREEVLGAHVHVTWFVGVDDDHLQNAGTIILGVNEWNTLRAAVNLGAGMIDEPRHPGPIMTWHEPTGYPGHHWILGRECSIWLHPRPGWCDRGRYHATLDAWGKLGLGIDGADGWPRYYFDLERAKAEIEAWLTVRGQDR